MNQFTLTTNAPTHTLSGLTLANGEPQQTMSSREIAELLHRSPNDAPRHDNVKRTMETLAPQAAD
jgi:phage regulator Rha-like protein